MTHFNLIKIDDAVNLTSELHDSNARMNHLQKEKERKDLTESIGVVSVKYPPNVKLDYSHNSRVLEKGKLCVP